jgi:protein-arginine kinase activator protein McsA
MLCETCQKREAVVHVTEVVAGEMKRHNLCETCFAESDLSKVIKSGKTAGWTSYNPPLPIPPDDESSR